MKRFLCSPPGVFAVFLLAYSVTWGGHFTSGDGQIKLAWAESLLFRGSSEIDPALGVTRSLYGIGHTLLAMPGLLLSHWIQNATGIHSKAALYTFLFVLNGALFLALVADYLSSAYPWRTVWLALLILGFATTWWPYTKVDFSEPLVLTFFFWGFLLVRKGKLIGGALLASAALLIRQDAVLLIAALGLWTLWRTRRGRDVAVLALATVPAVALEIFSNYLRFGTPSLGTGYAHQHFSNPFWIGVYGILFSAGKSVFAFSPPLLLGLIGWKRFRADPKLGADAPLFLAVFVIELVLYARWYDWSGDDSWGVRFMIPGVMLMCLPAVAMLERRVWAGPVVGLGVGVQLLAVLIAPLDYAMLIHLRLPERRLMYLGTESRHPIDFEDVRFNPSYSQLTGHWMMLRAKFGLLPAPPDEEEVGTSIAAAIPKDQLQVPWDFIWLRRR